MLQAPMSETAESNAANIAWFILECINDPEKVLKDLKRTFPENHRIQRYVSLCRIFISKTESYISVNYEFFAKQSLAWSEHINDYMTIGVQKA